VSIVGFIIDSFTIGLEFSLERAKMKEMSVVRNAEARADVIVKIVNWRKINHPRSVGIWI